MRSRSLALVLAAGFGYAFLYVPLAIVVVYSFNDSRLNAEWVGFTLDWYRKLAANEEMLEAAGNSLLIGLVASLVSTVLGTMAGVAMYRYRLRLLPVLVLALLGVAPPPADAALMLLGAALELSPCVLGIWLLQQLSTSVPTI